MIAHLFRLIWNRKRSQGLVLGEILVSFLVLCMVCTTIAYFVYNARKPLGFDWHDVWRVRMDYGEYGTASEQDRQAVWDRLIRLQQEARTLEGVEAAALMSNVPYSGSTSSWSMNVRGRELDMLFGLAGQEAPEVLRLDLVDGHWFAPGDENQDWVPLVINRQMAKAFFGARSPVGESLPRFDEAGRPEPRPEGEPDYRVIGVLSDYRRDGELSASPFVSFTPIRARAKSWPPDRILIRTRPGTTAAFEETISRRMHELAPDWSFDVRSMAAKRHDALRSRLMPLIIGGTAAAFLLVMVAMGLMGVLWLNVTRRTRELGLRRAMGATASGVRLQILGELLALTTLAVLLGALVFLQAPLLGIAGWVSWQVYAVGIVGSLLILYTLVVLCGLYPSWLATRVHPAQALHYE